MHRVFFVSVIILVVFIGASIIVQIVVSAGSLTPSASPASTLTNISTIQASINGTYDASSVTASSTGNVIEELRCIITLKEGGVC